MIVKASYLYSGMGDYFSGYGCKDNEALLYAFYGRETTARDIIDEWVEDSWSGDAGEDIPEEVTQDNIRAALLAMFTPAGRADYDSGALSEFAEAYADANGPLKCMECGARVNEMHDEDCEYNDGLVVDEEDTDEYDCCESPITVVVIEWEDDEEEEEDEGPACATCGDPYDVVDGSWECDSCKGD